MEFDLTTTAVVFLALIGVGIGGLAGAGVMQTSTVLMMVLPSTVVFGLICLGIGVKAADMHAAGQDIPAIADHHEHCRGGMAAAQNLQLGLRFAAPAPLALSAHFSPHQGIDEVEASVQGLEGTTVDIEAG
jgi:hypothetical protein